MTINELTRIATAAFGVHWRGHLAEALACSREIIWRYEHGHNPIPTQRALDIRAVCAKAMRKRISEIERVLIQVELA